MKVFISADIEGVIGATHVDETDKAHAEGRGCLMPFVYGMGTVEYSSTEPYLGRLTRYPARARLRYG